MPMPGENLFGWEVSNLTTLDGNFVATLETQQEFNDGNPQHYVMYHHYYLMTSIDGDTWDYSLITDGIEYFNIPSSTQISEITRFNSISLVNGEYKILATRTIYSNPVAIGGVANTDTENLLYSTSDLAVWTSSILPRNARWTSLVNNAGRACIIGDTKSEVHFTPIIVTNYLTNGAKESTVDSASTTETAAYSYLYKSNWYTDFTRQAKATASIEDTSFTMTGIVLDSAGAGYSKPPAVSFVGSSTTAATAVASANNTPAYFEITGIDVSANSGYGPASGITVTITNAVGDTTGSGISYSVSSSYFNTRSTITGISLINPGDGYLTDPVVTITGTGPATTSATAKILAPINIIGVNMISGGYGYSSAPTVSVTNGNALTNGIGIETVFTPTFSSLRPYIIHDVKLLNLGLGYIVPPTITVVPTINSAGQTTGSSAVIQLEYEKSGFGNTISISSDGMWLFASAPNAGKVQCYRKNFADEFTLAYSIIGDNSGEFGASLACSYNGNYLFVGSPKSEYNSTSQCGAVYIYSILADSYTLRDVLQPNEHLIDGRFGESLLLTLGGTELLVGAPGWAIPDERYYYGAVHRYLLDIPLNNSNWKFKFVQLIKKPFQHDIEHFGTTIAVDTKTKHLTVSSSDAYSVSRASQDGSYFMLDNSTTTVSDYVRNSGAVYLYDLLAGNSTTVYSYSQELGESGIKNLDTFGKSLAAGNGCIFVGSPNFDGNTINGGKVAIFENKYLSQSWQLIRKQEPRVDYKSVTRNYIYNQKQQNILAHLDIYDPAKGKLLGVAEDDIEFKTSFDPAAYNNTDPTTDIYCWGSQQVGKVWWDIDSVRYIEYEQGSLDYRTRNWGKMFPGSTVDVYEWVSSKVKPSEYSGDGVPKYTDDSKYVVQMNVHQATGLITTSYYFWVKNKETFDSLLPFRNSSILEISKFITYPTQQDIPYAAYIKNNAVSLFNSAKYISADSTIFHVGYDLLNTDTLIHNEFKLVNESAMTTDLPKNIVDKMIDSLSGEDQAGNVVPDYRLSEAERYGISIRPRQTMLVNKLQGVKNIVQYVNTVLKDVPASEEFDLTQLTAADKIPFTWDELGNSMLVNSYEELSYLDISALRKPVYAPAALNDPDNMAMLKLSSGQSILVMADNNFDNEWTIYEIDYEKNDLGVLDQTTPVFKLARMQSYRTADYWNYTDWYLPVYDFTAKPTYTVDTIKDMAKLTLAPNDTIHVRDSGGGKFKIFAVNNDLSTTVVGIQNGTIQLSDALWSHNTNKIGFDNDNFDSVKFDLNPSVELRNILYALRDSIFVNTLSTEFTKMFFMMLQYILSEQRLVDWVFKSSFISVLHNLRQLAQYPSYVRDNQTYLSDYINEIKPYRTKIREFVTQYDGNDIGNIISTDFDLPSYYDADLKTWRSPNNEHARDAGIIASRDEYLAWRTNNTYHIQSVTVETPGIGYIVPPTLTVTGGGLPDGDTRHAKLTAVVSFATGTVLRVNVDSHGSGYTSRPTIVVTGGGIDNSNIEGGVATCYAVMGNSNVRTFDTVIKFDRVSYSTDITPWQANTDYNTNNYVTFQHVVYQAIDSINSGDFFNITQFTKVADHGLSTAVDRSSAYYQPTPGMTPNIPERLFAGVDYPGNTIDGNRLDEEDYDTIIESYFTDLELGTDTDYSSIVDSGKFISAYTSHAPEEMLPGMMYDTLYITVINKDTGTLPPVGFRISSGMIQDYFTSFDIDSTTMFDGSSENFDTALTTFNELHTEFDDGLATFDRKPINWDITRVSESNTTVLTEPLVWPPVDANPVIHVADVSALPIPSLLLRKPGVIYINGERITYYTIDSVTNTLGQLRRGVAGTGIGAEYPVGAKVSDISVEQQLPAGSATKAWYPALSGVGITGYTNDGTGLMRQTSPQTAFLQQSPAGPVSISV